MEKTDAFPILYRLAPHDPAGHRYRITLTVQAPSPDGQRLSLPAWIPGSYLIRDFSRQIESLGARAGGRPVAVTKLDNHTWQAAPCDGPIDLRDAFDRISVLVPRLANTSLTAACAP